MYVCICIFLYEKVNCLLWERYCRNVRGEITSKSRREDGFLSDSFSTIAAVGIIPEMRSREYSRAQRGQTETDAFFFRPSWIAPGWLRVYISVLLSSFSRPPFPFFTFRIETETNRYLTRSLPRLPSLEFPKFVRAIISPLNLCGMVITG